MTVVDFHPDDLLDRSAKGLLTHDEHRRLHEHLRQCAVCRLELQLREDFRAEFAPYAESASMQRFVLDALSAASTHHVAPRAAPEPLVDVDELAPTRRKWQRRLLGPAAATLFLTGLAAAQYTGVAASVAALARRAFTEQTPASRAGANAPARRSPREQHMPAPRPEERRTTPSNTPVVAPSSALGANARASSGEDAQAHEAARAQRSARRQALPASTSGAREAQPPRDAHVSQGQANAQAAKGPSSAPVEPDTLRNEATKDGGGAGAPPASSSAAKLFAQANLARRQGRWPEASALYRELRTRYAESPEARLSMVVLARMQLDQGEASAALHGFDAYLASSDQALREEALTGRCMALQKLGRSEEERAAVRQLLAMYPDSPYARKAEKRLGARADE